MAVKPFHDPQEGPLRAVALMSGSGTNVRRILEHREKLMKEEGAAPFEVAAIFSDRHDSNAAEIGRDYDLPVLVRDLSAWLKKRGLTRKHLKEREEFDRETVEMLRPFKAKFAIYGGYMSIASPTLVRAFIGVNVHPADLTIKDNKGGRRFTGAHAVRDAIAAGEKFLRSTTHLVTEQVDMGPILMVSAGLPVEASPEDLSDPERLSRIAEQHQERLKKAGDWVIFPLTIEYLARGWFQRDEDGNIYFKGDPAPEGVRL